MVHLNLSLQWHLDLEICWVKSQSRFKGSENVQHNNLKIPLFERGGISEDLKSIFITIWYSASEVFVHLPCPSSNLVYRSLELTLNNETPVLHQYQFHSPYPNPLCDFLCKEKKDAWKVTGGGRKVMMFYPDFKPWTPGSSTMGPVAASHGG